MSKTLGEAGKGRVFHAEIVRTGEAITIPDGMDLREVIRVIERRRKFEEEVTEIASSIPVFPLDGANALLEVLNDLYGWAGMQAKQTMSGEQKPTIIEIEIGIGQTKTVPWGLLQLPGMESGTIETRLDWGGDIAQFQMVAQVKRKYEEKVQAIFETVRQYCRARSIYKGKAFRVQFTDDHGNQMDFPKVSFIDTSNAKPENLILAKKTMEQVETNIFTPIERIVDCEKFGIALKRGAMLGGTYGIGKTLTAYTAAHLAERNHVTFIYCAKARDIAQAVAFARFYEPAVVFCEDIDRALKGKRNEQMDKILNTIDGIESKESKIFIILTTNELDSINAAMLRPGRLDVVLKIDLPDEAATERLLRLYGGVNIPVATDLTKIRKLLDGSIPAVIKEVVNRAKLVEVKRSKPNDDTNMVLILSEASLLEAAETITDQTKIMESAIERQKLKTVTLDDYLQLMLSKSVRAHVNPEYHNHSGDDSSGEIELDTA